MPRPRRPSLVLTSPDSRPKREKEGMDTKSTTHFSQTPTGQVLPREEVHDRGEVVVPPAATSGELGKPTRSLSSSEATSGELGARGQTSSGPVATLGELGAQGPQSQGPVATLGELGSQGPRSQGPVATLGELGPKGSQSRNPVVTFGELRVPGRSRSLSRPSRARGQSSEESLSDSSEALALRQQRISEGSTPRGGDTTTKKVRQNRRRAERKKAEKAAQREAEASAASSSAPSAGTPQGTVRSGKRHPSATPPGNHPRPPQKRKGPPPSEQPRGGATGGQNETKSPKRSENPKWSFSRAARSVLTLEVHPPEGMGKIGDEDLAFTQKAMMDAILTDPPGGPPRRFEGVRHRKEEDILQIVCNDEATRDWARTVLSSLHHRGKPEAPLYRVTSPADLPPFKSFTTVVPTVGVEGSRKRARDLLVMQNPDLIPPGSIRVPDTLAKSEAGTVLLIELDEPVAEAVKRRGLKLCFGMGKVTLTPARTAQPARQQAQPAP